jgi:hypothetical protein
MQGVGMFGIDLQDPPVDAFRFSQSSGAVALHGKGEQLTNVGRLFWQHGLRRQRLMGRGRLRS